MTSVLDSTEVTNIMNQCDDGMSIFAESMYSVRTTPNSAILLRL